MARRLAVAAGVDAVIVVAFAGFGRRSHDESSGIGGTLSTAAPFLIALAVVWIAALAVRRGREASLLAVDAGVVIALATVAIGMVARRTLWDRGVAVAFIVVTTAFFAALMGGWRAAWAAIRSRRAHPSSPA